MRVTLTLSQLKKILRTERIKFPISFKGENFTDQELKEFLKLLQHAEERG
jgi:hypothetical protein